MNSIKLSDHFTYKRLFRFTLPSIAMMIFTSIYGVVDGIFVSNYVGETPFAALNNGKISAIISFMRALVLQVFFVMTLPLLFSINGIWMSIVLAEFFSVIITVLCLVRNRYKYRYV